MGGGKPAARQGDMTRKGLDIVQGSAGVLIGAPTGVACSVCPTKKDSPNYGSPVNPLTASRKMRTMSTATMNTAGWRRRRTVSRKG